jgi:hypothetical protein
MVQRDPRHGAASNAGIAARRYDCACAFTADVADGAQAALGIGARPVQLLSVEVSAST